MSEGTETPRRWFIMKTNGVANIRAINCALGSAPERPDFWLPGYMTPRKVRKETVLRKEFLFYDYAFLALEKPHEFEKFITDRGIPAYFIHYPGTKTMASLTDEEIKRVKDLEAFKQIESEQFGGVKVPVKVGSYIEIVNGPFIGCKGVVLEIGHRHIVMEMNVFGRPTRVNISMEFLEGLLENFAGEESNFQDDGE